MGGVGLSSLTRWIGQYRGEEMPPEIKDDLQAANAPSRPPESCSVGVDMAHPMVNRKMGF